MALRQLCKLFIRVRFSYPPPILALLVQWQYTGFVILWWQFDSVVGHQVSALDWYCELDLKPNADRFDSCQVHQVFMGCQGWSHARWIAVGALSSVRHRTLGLTRVQFPYNPPSFLGVVKWYHSWFGTMERRFDSFYRDQFLGCVQQILYIELLIQTVKKHPVILFRWSKLGVGRGLLILEARFESWDRSQFRVGSANIKLTFGCLATKTTLLFLGHMT